MKFGENLYNLRKNNKMSQEKLAEKFNVTRHRLRNIADNYLLIICLYVIIILSK